VSTLEELNWGRTDPAEGRTTRLHRGLEQLFRFTFSIPERWCLYRLFSAGQNAGNCGSIDAETSQHYRSVGIKERNQLL